MGFLDDIKLSSRYDNEYYRVYDENGLYLYDMDVKDEESLSRHFVKCVVCFVINLDGKVLVEKRAQTRFSPGEMDLVSGHINGQEISINAMKRELQEEVGISEAISCKVKKIGNMKLGFECGEKVRNAFIDFYYLLVDNPKLIWQCDEVESVSWIPLEDVFRMIRTGETKFPKQGIEVNYEKIFETVQHAYEDQIKGTDHSKEKKKVLDK